MSAPQPPPAAPQSPESPGAAGPVFARDRVDVGWDCEAEQLGEWQALLDRRIDGRNTDWTGWRALRESQNDVVAKHLDDVVDGRRARWVAAQRAAGVETRFPGLVVDHTDLREPSFIVVGDTGDQDASQYAVVPPLMEVGRGTDFMVILSDVVYPAGDVNEYVNAFYIPYAEYRGPIYALPGNHDWYDGLNGFMYHFCRSEPLPGVSYRLSELKLRQRLARLLWLQARRPNRALLAGYRRQRQHAEDPVQPGPYYAIDLPGLRLVAIDTGVSGRIDDEQGEWLRLVSRGDTPKVLLTGKPIYVNNVYKPCRILADARFATPGDTVDAIVRDPENHYVAAIGGDVHNYQRYPVRLRGGDGRERTIQYIVSGGGGAHLSATHFIPRVDVEPDRMAEQAEEPEPVEEGAFICYPRRGDSLARYAPRVHERLSGALAKLLVTVLVCAGAAVGLWWLGPTAAKWAAIIAPGLIGAACLAAFLYVLGIALPLLRLGGRVDPDQAAKYAADLMSQAGPETEPERPSAQEGDLDLRTKRLLSTLLPAAGHRRTILHGGPFSPFFDFNEPPFFKHFLRLDLTGSTLRIRCYGVTGYRRHELDPPLWDEVVIDLTPASRDGRR